MQGYDIDINNEINRKNLFKDAKFYNLRHLTELLIPARTYYNPFRGNASEIIIHLSDFKAPYSRIGLLEGQKLFVEGHPFGWMEYKRPHDIDKEYRDLVVQIDDDGVIVGGGKIMLINRQSLQWVMNLKEAAEGRKVEAHQGVLFGGRDEIVVRIEIPNECYCVLDGIEQPSILFNTITAGPPNAAVPQGGEETVPNKKRRTSEAGGSTNSLASETPSSQVIVLKRGLWRVKVKGQPQSTSPEGAVASNQPIGEGKRFMVLVGVKLEGWSRQREFVKELPWL